MIKKLRRKFVVAAMLAVVIVLGVIMITINVLNHRSMVADADEILNVLQENGGEFPIGPGRKDSDMPEPPGNTPLEPNGEDQDDMFDDDLDDLDDDPFEDLSRLSWYSEETAYESRYFVVTVDENGNFLEINLQRIAAIDSDSAREYASKVIKSGSSSGFSGNYRYSVSETDDGSSRIIFLDCSRSISSFRSFLYISILVSLIGLAGIFVLVLVFSGRIVRPVEESYEKQRRFITDAGHELRTPLTIIDADVSVAEMELEGAQDNEFLQDIKAQTKRLSTLTDELIYLSKMEEGSSPLTMMEFPVSELAEECAESYTSRAVIDNKDFAVDIQPMVSFTGDQRSILQLINLLLDNAFKYSPAGGKVSFSLKHEDQKLLLRVENDSAPIPQDDIAHLFDRFYRADKSRNSSTGGHGIGLSVAHAIVDSHKGKITASSRDGNSLRMDVVLPDNKIRS
ncbi:MAG: HAMP domain-containing histidine kinase [Lachnospiraceae bacterium]|nr:HAMP domain-containing histidine kinase [Lachnospiraceae bacterium]